jgi:hypothetical protein
MTEKIIPDIDHFQVFYEAINMACDLGQIIECANVWGWEKTANALQQIVDELHKTAESVLRKLTVAQLREKRRQWRNTVIAEPLQNIGLTMINAAILEAEE